MDQEQYIVIYGADDNATDLQPLRYEISARPLVSTDWQRPDLAEMAFKRVRFQDPEEDIERSTSFLKLKKRRTTQRTLLPGHEHGELPFPLTKQICRSDSFSERLKGFDIMHGTAEDDELEGELTEGYRGMADVEDLLWDDEPDQGVFANERCNDMAHSILRHELMTWGANFHPSGAMCLCLIWMSMQSRVQEVCVPEACT